MIDATDVTVLTSIGGCVVAAIALFTSLSRNSRADLESVRKEFAPQFESVRRELDTNKDSIRRDVETKVSSVRTEFDIKIEKAQSDERRERHDAINVVGNTIAHISSDVREIRKESMTKEEGKELESRLFDRMNEIRDDMKGLKDMLSQILVVTSGKNGG